MQFLGLMLSVLFSATVQAQLSVEPGQSCGKTLRPSTQTKEWIEAISTCKTPDFSFRSKDGGVYSFFAKSHLEVARIVLLQLAKVDQAEVSNTDSLSGIVQFPELQYVGELARDHRIYESERLIKSIDEWSEWAANRHKGPSNSYTCAGARNCIRGP